MTSLPPDSVLIDDNTISSQDPGGHTELPDHLNQITEELSDNTAVRRAVQDITEDLAETDPANADSEVQQLLARQNSGKPVNFVAEQLGEERKIKALTMAKEEAREPRQLVSGRSAKERWLWAYNKILQVGGRALGSV